MIERTRRWAMRRSRQQGASRRQDGFALMAVLAIIALTSITIAALLVVVIPVAAFAASVV